MPSSKIGEQNHYSYHISAKVGAIWKAKQWTTEVQISKIIENCLSIYIYIYFGFSDSVIQSIILKGIQRAIINSLGVTDRNVRKNGTNNQG